MGKRHDARWIERLSPQERLNAAAKKVEAMLDTAIELVHLHASNRIVCYSDAISSQIPRSFAGVAFRVFSKALLQRELSSVCTFWDSCSKDRNSIPTVVALLDDDAVRSLVRERKLKKATAGRYLSTEDDDPEMLAWMTRRSDADLADAASRRARLIDEAVRDAAVLAQSDMLKAARDFRDSHLAHSLSPDAKKFPTLVSRYGDERKLLEATQPILDKLDLASRDSSYDWEGTWRIAERNARALWNGVAVTVLE